MSRRGEAIQHVLERDLPPARDSDHLTAIVDWASRRVLSRQLSNTLEASFCIKALDEALERYEAPEVFNPDQGSQSTCEGFTSVLAGHGVQIGMHGRGRRLDNVFIERLRRSADLAIVDELENERHPRRRTSEGGDSRLATSGDTRSAIDNLELSRWREVLGDGQVGERESFWQPGGHSAQSGVRYSDSDCQFCAGTWRGFAECVRQRPATTGLEVGALGGWT